MVRTGTGRSATLSLVLCDLDALLGPIDALVVVASPTSHVSKPRLANVLRVNKEASPLYLCTVVWHRIEGGEHSHSGGVGAIRGLVVARDGAGWTRE